MKIIKYTYEHKNACIRIFQGNLDKYFSDAELNEFESYLETIAAKTAFFVVLRNNEVVACGGYERSGQVAGLCWGMVHRSYHSQSIGTLLLEYRLASIAKECGECDVLIDTSQHTKGFYKKHGFEVTETVKNGYGEGLDRVHMLLRSGNT